MVENNSNEISKPQSKLIAEVEKFGKEEDLLLVKLLVTNIPVIEAEYGQELALKALAELEKNFLGLGSIAVVERVSNVLFAVRAIDSSNPLSFIREVKAVVAEVNIQGNFRFLMEVSIGAVLTDHTSELTASEWLERLNLALMKSTRTGQPEIADSDVAKSEQVRQELARLGPGSKPPEGMHWVFQPINYVSNGEIFGYEALCRWDSPTLGSISPDVFIQIAEDLNLVQIIDFWTLKAVESSFEALMARGGQTISINISAQTLGNNHEFLAAVDQVLPKIIAAHGAMIIELTETSVIENQLDLGLGMLALRKRGAHIAIDDFGTGKTSLSVISSLPTDFVKLDGSLLQVERPDLSKGLLELGVKFAELVGAKVIVEKVETKEDLELAREVGAQFVQGWLYGQPVDLRTEVNPK